MKSRALFGRRIESIGSYDLSSFEKKPALEFAVKDVKGNFYYQVLAYTNENGSWRIDKVGYDFDKKVDDASALVNIVQKCSLN